MNVTVFGGAAPLPGQPAYLEALSLGRLLGERGHTVLTGGYVGTMEAVSRGAAEAGAHVIGVTCVEVERWRKRPANPWVLEEWKMPTLESRMVRMMENCSAAIALPGGVGTLAEITLLWNKMIIQAIPRRPLALIGQGWRDSFAGLFSSNGAYFPETHREMLFFASSLEEALEFIEKPNQSGSA